ncbi:hypothetical protein HEQ69_11075 [Haematospirillum jordaniae]|uniref:hypothetical protein n=1 Tax=Haematospirillum jordaniae TaxID=1549855 RepID=UPI00143311CC|nr:hypothetical protein [Haematospirillum jordaniae]NKD46245.1 hypothetical protein [Haematospirillum jordaniae]
MTAHERMPLEEFVKLSVWQAALLPAADLRAISADVAALRHRSRVYAERLREALEFKYAAAIAKHKEKIGAGDVSFTLFDRGHTVSVTLNQIVTWDQAKRHALESMVTGCGHAPEEYMTYSYTVSPRCYAALPSQTQALFDTARKVTAGPPSFLICLAS